MRAFLVIETARALGRSDAGPVRAAAAIECLHAYSLIHDDLPAMDDDDLRRGRPTAHRAFDEATAILAGDALQTIAFEILADPGADPSAATRAALCAGLARAAGLAGMVGGQMLDIAAETSTAPHSTAEIARLQAMKTGALIRFSVEAGARLAGASPSTLSALLDYGAAIGAAFQVADDLLDAEGDTATLGKRAGKDAERSKATLVAALGAEGARRELAALVEKAKTAVDAARTPRRRRRSESDGRFRRVAKELTVPISRAPALKTPSAADAARRLRPRLRRPLTAPLSLPPARRDSRGRARS